MFGEVAHGIEDVYIVISDTFDNGYFSFSRWWLYDIGFSQWDTESSDQPSYPLTM
jgi:hypothetical protein